MVAIVISSGNSSSVFLLTISLFLRSSRSCISVTLDWDFRSGLLSCSLLFAMFAPDGSGFHFFNKDSVSLSKEAEEEEYEERDVEAEETTAGSGE